MARHGRGRSGSTSGGLSGCDAAHRLRREAFDGRPVSSSEIRRLVTTGDLAAAERLLGRPYAVVGAFDPGSGAVSFALPVALPPPGEYRVVIGSYSGVAQIDGRGSVLPGCDPAA